MIFHCLPAMCVYLLVTTVESQETSMKNKIKENNNKINKPQVCNYDDDDDADCYYYNRMPITSPRRLSKTAKMLFSTNCTLTVQSASYYTFLH